MNFRTFVNNSFQLWETPFLNFDFFMSFPQQIFGFIQLMSQQAQFTKWTPDEDEKLLKAVQKCGVQWKLVYVEIGKTRSENSIIKRWHGHLKHTVDLHTFWNDSNVDMKGVPKTGKDQPQKNEHEKRQRNREEVKKRVELKKVEEESSSSSDSEEEEEEESSEDYGKKEKNNEELIKKMTNDPFQWKKVWSDHEDNKFRSLVVDTHLLDWEKLQIHLGTTEEELKHRWYKIIFPKMRNNAKIGGSYKWSMSEDSILIIADKLEISFLDLMFFLPTRTVYSMEARWRRIGKTADAFEFSSQAQTPKTNEKNRNQILAKIALARKIKKKEAMQKIFEREKQILEWQKKECERLRYLQRHTSIRK